MTTIKNKKDCLPVKTFELLLNASPVPLMVLDQNQAVNLISQSFTDEIGYELEDLPTLNKWLLAAYPEREYRENMMRLGQKKFDAVSAQIDSASDSYEAYIQCKDGSTKPFAVLVSRLVTESGDCYYQISYTNISEYKKSVAALRQSEAQLRAFLGVSLDGFAMISLQNGRFQQVNEAFCNMLGYGADEFALLTVNEIESKESPDTLKSRIYQVISKGADIFESNLRHKNGSIIDVEIHIAYNDQYPDKAYTLVRDISKRKAEQRELELARQLLHRNVLVREVHHRIKNNLHGITGILQALVMSQPDLSDPIKKVVGQLNGVAIIHGLQGSSLSHEVRIDELIHEIITNNQSVWMKDIVLKLSATPCEHRVAENEAVPIALILNELITNAVKYHQSSDKIIVTLSSSLNGGLKISIQNHAKLPEVLTSGDMAFKKREQMSGLSLAFALMPKNGAKLYWQQLNEHALSILELEAPIVTW